MAGLTCREDLQNDHQVGHIVSGRHGTLLVRSYLAHLFNLLGINIRNVVFFVGLSGHISTLTYC